MRMFKGVITLLEIGSKKLQNVHGADFPSSSFLISWKPTAERQTLEGGILEVKSI